MLSAIIQYNVILRNTTSAVAPGHGLSMTAACMVVHKVLVAWSSISTAAALALYGMKVYLLHFYTLLSLLSIVSTFELAGNFFFFFALCDCRNRGIVFRMSPPKQWPLSST